MGHLPERILTLIRWVTAIDGIWSSSARPPVVDRRASPAWHGSRRFYLDVIARRGKWTERSEMAKAVIVLPRGSFFHPWRFDRAVQDQISNCDEPVDGRDVHQFFRNQGLAHLCITSAAAPSIAFSMDGHHQRWDQGLRLSQHQLSV